MNQTTVNSVDEKRVIELLACYGAEPAGWPEEERFAAQRLIESSPALQRHRQAAQRLDQAMNIHAVREAVNQRADLHLVAGIIDALPEQGQHSVRDIDPFEKDPTKKDPTKKNPFKKDPLNKKAVNSWWQYSVVALAATLLLSVILVVKHTVPTLPTQATALSVAGVSRVDDLDRWLWQEATGDTQALAQDPVVDENGGPVTFMAMVELELLPIDGPLE